MATADALTPAQREALAGVRLLMSAGAPVPAPLLRAMLTVLPRAEAHTPYGMTEVLPVADIDLRGMALAGRGDGVCVGFPVAGAEIAIDDVDGAGEILVRAPWAKDRYDRLWATESAASHPDGWHRTGDVGHLDADGRLWVEGRLAHVVWTADGPVTPVGVEQRVEALPEVEAAACVGVGPAGAQVVVVVAVPRDGAPRRGGLADPELAAAVRDVAGVPVAAVLVRPALPVDIRHNSKIDRAALARWASHRLA